MLIQTLFYTFTLGQLGPNVHLLHAVSAQMMLTVSDVSGRTTLCDDGMPLPAGAFHRELLEEATFVIGTYYKP